MSVEAPVAGSQRRAGSLSSWQGEDDEGQGSRLGERSLPGSARVSEQGGTTHHAALDAQAPQDDEGARDAAPRQVMQQSLSQEHHQEDEESELRSVGGAPGDNGDVPPDPAANAPDQPGAAAAGQALPAAAHAASPSLTHEYDSAAPSPSPNGDDEEEGPFEPAQHRQPALNAAPTAAPPHEPPEPGSGPPSPPTQSSSPQRSVSYRQPRSPGSPRQGGARPLRSSMSVQRPGGLQQHGSTPSPQLHVQTMSPLGLEDPVIKPEQLLAQMGQAPGLQRALSMAAPGGAAAAGVARSTSVRAPTSPPRAHHHDGHEQPPQGSGEAWEAGLLRMTQLDMPQPSGSASARVGSPPRGSSSQPSAALHLAGSLMPPRAATLGRDSLVAPSLAQQQARAATSPSPAAGAAAPASTASTPATTHRSMAAAAVAGSPSPLPPHGASSAKGRHTTGGMPHTTSTISTTAVQHATSQLLSARSNASGASAQLMHVLGNGRGLQSGSSAATVSNGSNPPASARGGALAPARVPVPEGYVPQGFEGKEMSVPMHLLTDDGPPAGTVRALGGGGGGTHRASGLPFDDGFNPAAVPPGQHSSRGMAAGGSSAYIQAPHKLHGSIAMPFAERKLGSTGVNLARTVGKLPLGGSLVKTAGRSHPRGGSASAGAARPQPLAPEASVASNKSNPGGFATAGEGAAVSPEPGHPLPTSAGGGQPLSAPSRPSPEELLMGLVQVRGAHKRHEEHPAPLGGATKPRRKGPGRINFKSLRPLPATLNAGGGGELLVGKAKQGLARRMMAVEQNMFGPSAFHRKYEPPPATPDAITMDGFVLLEAGDDDMPEGIVAARLSGKNIGGVEQADLGYFTGLRVLDLSDNKLPSMSVLSPLTALQALSLSLNRLTTLGEWDTSTAAAFQNLVTLDLSYNQLGSAHVLGPDSPLAGLPTLRELNLSSNALEALPDSLGAFPALELLKLADNLLTGAALVPLSRLPALTSLNMSKNRRLQGLVLSLDALGAPEPGGYTAEQVLHAAGLPLEQQGDPAPSGHAACAFPALRALDLSSCAIADAFLVEPLRALPCLARLLLAGNPLAVATMQALRRQEQKRAKASMLAADGAILAPGALEPAPQDPVLEWQPAAAQGPRPTVAGVLAGGGGRFLAVREPLGRREAERAASLAAVAAVSEEQVGVAFQRVDQAIEAWQLNTVPEGDEDQGEQDEEEEEEEEDGEVEPDMTFLTGVGITEKVARTKGGKQQEEQEGPAAQTCEGEQREAWEDVEDPTERLALALGLDPRRLAIYTGKPTQDALGAVNALRFALSHPLVEANEGLEDAPAQHMQLTAAARAKRRDRAVRLDPLAGVGGAPGGAGLSIPPDPRTLKIQTVEGTLSAMRTRLASLESTLASRLAALPSAAAAAAAGGPRTSPSPHPAAAAVVARAETPVSDVGSDEVRAMVGSPLFPRETVDGPEAAAGGEGARAPDPFQTRVLGGENGDAASDVSALPDEVMEAIENSDPSDQEDAGSDAGDFMADAAGGAGGAGGQGSSEEEQGVHWDAGVGGEEGAEGDGAAAVQQQQQQQQGLGSPAGRVASGTRARSSRSRPAALQTAHSGGLGNVEALPRAPSGRHASLTSARSKDHNGTPQQSPHGGHQRGSSHRRSQGQLLSPGSPKAGANKMRSAHSARAANGPAVAIPAAAQTALGYA